MGITVLKHPFSTSYWLRKIRATDQNKLIPSIYVVGAAPTTHIDGIKFFLNLISNFPQPICSGKSFPRKLCSHDTSSLKGLEPSRLVA